MKLLWFESEEGHGGGDLLRDGNRPDRFSF
jgi:hypothetical protein